jgi:hypothetical protein
MKTTKIRLDVDQIGGNGSLTPSDEKNDQPLHPRSETESNTFEKSSYSS